MTEQQSTLVKIAIRQHKNLAKLIGQEVPNPYNSSNEKIQLYISYPHHLATFNGKYWDIPQYTNGTTRRAQCLFLLGPMYTGDGTHAYLGDREEIERRLKDSEREKILIQEEIDGNFIEIIWSYDIASPNSHGQYYYYPDYFWFAIRINGIIIEKLKDINDLKIPALTQKCIYCEKEKPLYKMELSNKRYNPQWVCKSEDKSLYSKCPD